MLSSLFLSNHLLRNTLYSTNNKKPVSLNKDIYQGVCIMGIWNKKNEIYMLRINPYVRFSEILLGSFDESQKKTKDRSYIYEIKIHKLRIQGCRTRGNKKPF